MSTQVDMSQVDMSVSAVQLREQWPSVDGATAVIFLTSIFIPPTLRRLWRNVLSMALSSVHIHLGCCSDRCTELAKRMLLSRNLLARQQQQADMQLRLNTTHKSDARLQHRVLTILATVL